MFGRLPRPEPDPFWDAECRERGPGLKHRHPRDCADDHAADECCHCGHTAQTWAMLQSLVADTTVIPPAAEDDKPLELEQAPRFGNCSYGHSSTKQLIGDKGLEWEKCAGCGVYKEPKAATGGPIGSVDGIGRGWISPRSQARWTGIAYRLRREARTRFTRTGKLRRRP